MYSRRLIDLENTTQIREENVYSDRLLTLEKRMEEQRNGSDDAKPSDGNSEEIKDEPIDFLDDLLENVDKVVQEIATPNEKSLVKPEPEPNDDEEIDPNFFDELLQRAEVERRDDKASTSNSKRNRSNKDANAVPDKKRIKREGQQNEETEKKPRLQVRSDLGLFSTVPGKSKLLKPPIDPLAQSLLFIDEVMESELTTDPQAAIRVTAQEKMSKALERILYARRAFEKARCQNERKFYPKSPVFIFTQTIRKLPSSSTHFTQQIYDNRSPLHTVNNVSFSFNSTTTRLNLHDWGIESPPPAALKVARILGYDAETLYLKRSSIKIPDKIQKSKNTTTETDALFEQSSSTLFINATVQTDEVRIVPLRRADFYRNVGIQYNPQTSVATTQTSSCTVSELPLMQAISELNENQLLAVEDFVQLIKEPSGQAGIDIYQKRSRLHEIYKMSQQPPLFSSTSMPQAPPPPTMRSFNDDSDEEYNSYRGAEIKHEYGRDPRFNQNRGRPSPYQGGQLEPIPNNSTKYYGRGGKRR